MSSLRHPQRTAPKLSQLAVEGVILVVVVAAMVPVVWTVVMAFLPNRAIVKREFDFPFWIGNFQTLFADDVFVVQLLNSALIVLGTVAACLVLGSFAGYSLARLSPPKWIVVPSMVIAVAIPLIPPATLVPGLYLLLNQLGILGTIPGLIAVNTFFNLPFAALLMASYFGALPDELREAALMDGASESRVFFSVMLPLVRPGLGAVGVFVGIMAWNEFLMGLTLTSGGRSAPVTVGIASLLQDYSVTWGQLSAAGTVAAVPLIVLAIFANRQIVSGLTAGAVKG